ncbi:hypothetical protein [Enterococcus mundtii]|uniref:Uncharacterized protein n=1 Tax=Enterococcus mundtii TaxID=53346 RepID=A0A2S7S007_ENTMU|nr:hypothetical protein [Enterococcus mundtii]PQF25886.1 hypothetical protein CUS89_00815 [Enterococcus mundtii]
MENKTKKRWLTFLLLLFGLLGILLYVSNGKEEAVPLVSADLLPGLRDASDIEIAERAQEIADANYFTLQIAPFAVFDNGESEGSIEIVNPGTNVYPIAVDLSLADTEEVIYSSGAIHPNQQIIGAKLDKPLEKGEYLAVARINIYDPETNERQGITEAEITITINN